MTLGTGLLVDPRYPDGGYGVVRVTQELATPSALTPNSTGARPSPRDRGAKMMDTGKDESFAGA